MHLQKQRRKVCFKALSFVWNDVHAGISELSVHFCSLWVSPGQEKMQHGGANRNGFLLCCHSVSAPQYDSGAELGYSCKFCSAAKKVSLGRVCGVERVGVVGSSWALGADFTDLWTERHLVPCSQLWVSKLMFYCSLPVCLVPSIPWLSQTRFLGTAADCLERISSLVLFKLRCLRKVEQSYNLHFSKCLWCINIAKALRNGKYHFFNFTSFENSMSFQKDQKFIMGEHQTSCKCFYL